MVFVLPLMQHKSHQAERGISFSLMDMQLAWMTDECIASLIDEEILKMSEDGEPMADPNYEFVPEGY